MESSKSQGKLQDLWLNKDKIKTHFVHPSIVNAFDEEIIVILELLEKLKFLRSEQILILKTVERLTDAYSGRIRKVEKIGNIKKPKVFHQLDVLKQRLAIFHILRNPHHYNIPKEYLQEMEPYKNSLLENKIASCIALLHHDTPEDDAFIFVDEHLDHSANLLQEFFPDIDKSLEMYDQIGEKFNNYCISNIHLTRFNSDALVTKYFPHLLAIQKGQAYAQLSLREKCLTKNELALYNLCNVIVHDGFPKAELSTFLHHMILYTPLKIDNLSLETEEEYHTKLASNKNTLIGKMADTLSNTQSITQSAERMSLHSQAKEKFLNKYTNRIHWLNNEMTFSGIMANKIFSLNQYKKDKFVSSMFEQEQKIAGQVTDLFKKNVSKHILPILNEQPTPKKELVEEWTDQIVHNIMGAKEGKKLEHISRAHPLKSLHSIIEYGVFPKEMASVMDMNNYPFTIQQTLAILKALLGENVQRENRELLLTSRGVEMINDVLNKALRFYTEFEYQHVSDSFIKKWCVTKGKNKEIAIKLNSGADLVEFLKTARKKEGLHQTTACSLLLNAYGCALLYLSKKVQDQNHKFTKILSDYILKMFQPLAYSYGKNAYELIREIVDENDDQLLLRDSLSDPNRIEQITNSVKDKCNHILTIIENLKLQSDQTGIDFMNNVSKQLGKIDTVYNDISSVMIKNLYLRGKGGESVLHRFFRKVDANLDVVLDDLLGVKTEYYNIHDLLLHMNHMYYVLFRGKAKIKLKGLITWDDLRKSKSSLSPAFYKELKKLVIKQQSEETQRGISNEDYNDIKLIGKICKDDDYPEVERQFTLSSGKNDQWFSMHEAYDAKKVLNTVTRQEFYASIEYIDYLSLRYAYKFPNVRKLGSGDIVESAQALSKSIQKKFLPLIVSERRPSNSAPISFFTRRDRWNVLSQSNLIGKDKRVYDKENIRWINKPFYSRQLEHWGDKYYKELINAIEVYKGLISEEEQKIITNNLEEIKFHMEEFEKFHHVHYLPTETSAMGASDERQNKIVEILKNHYKIIYTILVVKKAHLNTPEQQ